MKYFENRLASVINELFDTEPLDLKWSINEYGDPVAKFVIVDEKPSGTKYEKIYEVNFIRDRGVLYPDAKTDNYWEVTFSLITYNAYGSKKASQGITGTGDALAVFTTVLKAIEIWIKKYKPDVFVIAATEKNRQSLYKKMLSSMLPPGWKISPMDFSDGFFEIKRTK